jgi:hypothetical protein
MTARKKGMSEQFGPDYNIDSAKLKRFRFAARDSLSTLTHVERQAYGADMGASFDLRSAILGITHALVG